MDDDDCDRSSEQKHATEFEEMKEKHTNSEIFRDKEGYNDVTLQTILERHAGVSPLLKVVREYAQLQ